MHHVKQRASGMNIQEEDNENPVKKVLLHVSSNGNGVLNINSLDNVNTNAAAMSHTTSGRGNIDSAMILQQVNAIKHKHREQTECNETHNHRTLLKMHHGIVRVANSPVMLICKQLNELPGRLEDNLIDNPTFVSAALGFLPHRLAIPFLFGRMALLFL